MRLYVASSWRNPYQPEIVNALRDQGHTVYDFRHPDGGDHLGFSWVSIDPEWEAWTPEEYMLALTHPVAVAGYESDYTAMENADAGILLLPSGKSAHLEAGYFAGAGKPLHIILSPHHWEGGVSDAELMYKMGTVWVDRYSFLDLWVSL